MENNVRFYSKNQSADYGVYNPNTFNALDAAIVFIVFLGVEFGVGKVFASLCAPYINDPEFDFYSYLLVAAVISQLIVFSVAFIASRIRRVDYLSGGGFIFRLDMVNAFFGVMLAVSLILLFSDLHYSFVDSAQRLFYGRSLQEYEQLLKDRMRGDAGYYLLYTFVVVPVFPAFFEEAFCRGVIMRGTSQFGKGFAIIVSAIFFTLMHGNLNQVVLQFVFGLAVGAVVMLTQNFAVGCFMHLFYNVFVVVTEAVQTSLTSLSDGAGYVGKMVMTIIGLVLFVVSLVYFAKLFIAKIKQKAIGKTPRYTVADLNTYALIADNDSNGGYSKIIWQSVGIGEFGYQGKTCNYKGKHFILNSKSNGVISIVFLTIAALISLVLIFVPA